MIEIILAVMYSFVCLSVIAVILILMKIEDY